MSKTKKYLVVGFVAVALFSIGYQKTIGRSLHADIKEITPLSQAISTKSSNTSPIENSKVYSSASPNIF